MKPEPFIPAFGLRNPHLQTLWSSLIRQSPLLKTRRERVELNDGDFIDLDWAAPDDTASPIVLIIHGLAGSIHSPYVSGLVTHLTHSGMQPVVMHLRGCSGVINRLPRLYHSGETGDLNFIIERIRACYPQRLLYAIGFSLGGNMLLKWLGECAAENPLQAAVAVSVPFDLYRSALQLARGASRIYQWNLLRSLKRTIRAKVEHSEIRALLPRLNKLKNFYQFDDAITAPLHGFAGAMDYYQRNSCRQFLIHIRTPTLILHALDDPFLPQEYIPGTDELSASVHLELSPHGGHVGFVSGTMYAPQYWLESRITAFLQQNLLA